MALYDRDYTSTEAGYVQEGASVSFMKHTYQLLAASMIAAAAGAYATMPYAETIMQYKWFIFGAELLILFFGLSMSRGKAGLKKKLIDYYNSNPSLFYVGEWHTHNSNSIAPSSVDIIAMQTIEEYPNLGIISPLLLIIGRDGDEYSIGFYIQYKKKLYKYEYED